MDITYLSIDQLGAFRFFPLLAILSDSAVNIHIQDFVWTYAFISWSLYLGVQMLDRMVTLGLTYEDFAKLFPKVASFYVFYQQYLRVSVSPYPFLILAKVMLLSIVLLECVKLCLILTFIYVSLVGNDVEHLFMCPLAITFIYI